MTLKYTLEYRLIPFGFKRLILPAQKQRRLNSYTDQLGINVLTQMLKAHCALADFYNKKRIQLQGNVLHPL